MNSILQPPYSSQLGANVSVANVTFTAIAAGSGALTVDILGMAQLSGAAVSATTAAVAAAGTVSSHCTCTDLLSVERQHECSSVLSWWSAAAWATQQPWKMFWS